MRREDRAILTLTILPHDRYIFRKRLFRIDESFVTFRMSLKVIADLTVPVDSKYKPLDLVLVYEPTTLHHETSQLRK